MNQTVLHLKRFFGKFLKVRSTAPDFGDLWETDKRTTLKSSSSQSFVSEEDLESIKDRIKKKHHTNTTKLLTMYGLMLIIFIWCLKTFEII